mgnify:CR=1 FL=1
MLSPPPSPCRSKFAGAAVQAKRTLIHDHFDHCLEETIGPLPREKRGTVDEFKEIAKYL